MSNAAKGNWDEDFKENEQSGSGNGNSSSPKTEFMKMDKAGEYRVRLVGAHVKCRKHFKPYRAVVQDNEKDIDPAWKAGFFPQKRYAINVIDRADGRLKVLEKGATVFKQFSNYKAVFGKDPAGKEGPDFMIKVTIPKGKDGQPNKMKTEYAVTHIKETPFTEKEMEMIKAQKLWPLPDIYKSTSAEEMKKMWDELPAEKKIAPKREFKDGEESVSKAVAQTEDIDPIDDNMADAPADSNDLFEKKTAETKTDVNQPSGELF